VNRGAFGVYATTLVIGEKLKISSLPGKGIGDSLSHRSAHNLWSHSNVKSLGKYPLILRLEPHYAWYSVLPVLAAYL
jgi:hypothetical protein